ncbi:putative MFS family arabinose efflux permease [Actinokineospora auranticolor]|uniref:Putative MFS family arabinose efflux permease n=1 Tax=Actinokineospora auranticolor TaxID=155976 RepID=A0A2S6GCI7_9PSEU|nr:putative MFS family arabinose efflux permease [Actinokineospora auranticolor]
MTTTDTPDTTRGQLWSGRNRATTLGILLLITIAAFEQLGVSTAMPSMLADLRGGALYSWPFTAALSASVVATVVGGWICDRWGYRVVLLVAPTVFLLGLVLAGTATGMPALLVARACQGLGLGGEVVAIYVLIAAVYPERLRPTVFGLTASAWVVPSIVGPTVAGLVTERFGWRWVFLGLVPLALLGVVLLLPALRTVPAVPAPDPDTVRRKGIPLAAVAAGVGIPAVSWAAQHPSPATLWLGLAGLALLVPALGRLLPKGTLRGAPGLPRVILARGLFAGAFFSVEAFVPLTLTSVHGFSPALAGLPLTAGALGWSAASAWQGRRPEVQRTALIRVGFAVLAAGLASMVVVAAPWGWPWAAAALWAVAGVGMGLGFPSINVLALGAAPEHERGFTSAALQVSDMVASATLVGLGGLLLTALASTAAPTAAVVPTDLLMAGVAVLGLLLFRRSTDDRV